MLAAFRDETGIEHQGLFMIRRDHPHHRGLVELHKVNSGRKVSGKGPFMVGAVAASVAERDRLWQHQQQPHEMHEKLPLWPLEMGEGRQYTLEEAHELSSCRGQLGNLTLEDDGSCGYLSLNKTVRSIEMETMLL